MPPTWPSTDLVTPNGTIDPLRLANMFKYSNLINAPAGLGLVMHHGIRFAQVGSCIGVLLGFTRSMKIPNLGFWASHGGRIGGALGVALICGKTVIDETMTPFEIDERTRKLKENVDDEKMTLTTLTFSMYVIKDIQAFSFFFSIFFCFY